MPADRSLQRRHLRGLVAAMLCFVITGGPVSAQSDETDGPEEVTANKVTPAGLTIPPAVVELPQLPVAFSKEIPESLQDLQEMEVHVQSLVPGLKEATVALTVGHAQGSGVIVSADGFVLTAAHVSGPPGGRVLIRLADGSRAFGQSLGRNNTLDASLIKIESPEREWPHVAMANFKDIGVGDWSIVMGHPGGYQPGRPPVFRLGRVIHVDDQVIQTDNELVGGDSGGPLFDMHGRVIGINSRIGPSTTFNLHTPIKAFNDDWDRLVASEEFIYHSGALLGVFGEPGDRGLKLTKVWPDEPAGQAGLQEGDILHTFQSVRVRGLEHLIELVGAEQPGRRVKLTVFRDGELMEFEVRLGSKE